MKLETLIAKHSATLDSNSQKSDNMVEMPFFENQIRCLSIADMASATSLSTKTCERLVKRGELFAKKVGRRWVIPLSSFESWLFKKGA